MGNKNSLNFSPVISVVIPVYNDYERLKLCVDALLMQTCYLTKTEIIIVDNNSKNIPSWLYDIPNIKIFKAFKQSSYAARNVGIKNAKGNVIAFLDSDCIPGSNWLKCGYNALVNKNYNIVAGRIKIIFSQKPLISEVVDSFLHLKQKERVINSQEAATANLFVKKSVFNNIGVFPELKSGGDTIFSQKASQSGFIINYDDAVVVSHPARKLIPLLKKRLRVGINLPILVFFIKRKKTTKTIFVVLIKGFKGLLPPVKTLIKKKYFLSFAGFWLLWLCKMITSVGCIYGLCYLLIKENTITIILKLDKKK